VTLIQHVGFAFIEKRQDATLDVPCSDHLEVLTKIDFQSPELPHPDPLRNSGTSTFPTSDPVFKFRRAYETAQATDEFQDIRDGVAKLCKGFPGEYWRELDRERAYPTKFVKASAEASSLNLTLTLTLSGFLFV